MSIKLFCISTNPHFVFFTGCLYSGGIDSSWLNQFHDLQGRGHLSIASVSLLGDNHQKYEHKEA